MTADPPKITREPDVAAPAGGDKVVRLDQTWRGRLRHGLRKLRQGDHRAAATAFERALAEAPDEPEVLLAAGRAHVGQARYAEAEAVLRRALELQPDSVTAAALYARVLGLHLDRQEQAFGVILRFLARHPDAAPLHVIRGELLLEEGAISDARAAFGMVLDLDVTDPAARLGVARSFNAEGITLSDEGDSERAVFCFKRAADLDPQWSGPLVNLGVVFGRLGRLDRALEAYAEALARDPANPVAYFNLATAHQELGAHEEAITGFEQLLELCPDYPQARIALATTLAERNDIDRDDLDRAIGLLLEELEIDPRSVTAWTSLGLAYTCSGNPERGEQCLLRALGLDPEYFNAYYNLAALYVAEQRHDDAERMLQHALERQPEQTSRLVAQDRQFDAVRDLPRFKRITDRAPSA